MQGGEVREALTYYNAVYIFQLEYVLKNADNRSDGNIHTLTDNVF